MRSIWDALIAPLMQCLRWPCPENAIIWLYDSCNHGFRLGSSDNDSPRKVSYIPEATISGVVYTDLLQHEFIDNSNRFMRGEVVDDAKWVRMLLAKGVGLLQYELLSGEVFTLVRN